MSQKITVEDIPSEWWQQACQHMRHPIECSNADGRFIWVNDAFENVVGYSATELKKLKWPAITHSADIGGELESKASLVEGKADRFRTSKRYLHKLGSEIAVEIRVYRYPRVGQFQCFIVEVVREDLTSEIESLRDRIAIMLRAITERLEQLETKRADMSSDNRNTINIGGNDPKWIAFIVAAIVAGVAFLAWRFIGP